MIQTGCIALDYSPYWGELSFSVELLSNGADIGWHRLFATDRMPLSLSKHFKARFGDFL